MRAVLLFLIFPFAVNAQNCVEIKNSITGKTNKTGIVRLSQSISPVLTFLKQSDNFKLSYVLQLPKPSQDIAADSLILIIKFADGSQRSVFPSAYTSVKEEPDQSIFVSFISEAINDNIKYFKKNSFSDISLIYKGNRLHNIILTSKVSSNIKGTVSCVAD